MKKLTLGIITFLSLSFVTAGMASNPPRALSSDSRIKVVAYDQNQVVPVQMNLMTNTQFILNQDEHILDVQSGDATAWIMDNHNEPPYMFFLKPVIAGSNTNVTVVTDKRIYYFRLVSSPDINPRNAAYAVRFIYPDEEKAKMLKEQAATLNLSKDPNAYNWGYSFSGSKNILPLHVFDDGQFTYMQLRPGQPVPAIFAVDNWVGQESVVNFRRQGDYLVIERTAPQFTLRAGQYDVVSIFNDVTVKKIWNNGRSV
ncbi:MAG: TrbG/VirB9 family P-type conjugative transfer protein [Legionellales bacterium]|nr:TrbG/VirB9 family P-type conjugative transfer protein [Legionellales bacterium]